MANSAPPLSARTEPLWESLLNQVQVDFYSARFHRCAADWRNVPRVIRDEMLHLVHAGTIRWRLGSEEFDSPPGSLVFIPPDIEWEAWRISEDLIRVSVIHFDAYFPGRQRYTKALGYGHLLTGADFQRMNTLFRALNHCYLRKESGHALKERAILYDLFYEIFGQRGPAAAMSGQGQQALQVVAYLRNHFHEEISRESLSHRFHLSSGHLAVIFKEYTGESPMGYLLRLRIQRAGELLTVTANSVAEIAAAVGFEDAAYFSRIFKQQAGVSPLQYRKEQQTIDD